MKVPFLNLKLENELIKAVCIKKISRFVDGSNFILGQEVELFEKSFAKFCGSKFAVGVNSGTDALHIALRACGIKDGDEVITTPISYTATSLAIAYCNAKPVFVDISPDGNIDPSKIEKAITAKTRAILVVHMYGNPCDLYKIGAIAKKHKLLLIDDCAHAHGARYKGRMIGSLSDISCWSFYPTKNLGAWGDAGAITTNSESLYTKSRLFRNYGEVKKNDSSLIGYNSRLQGIQAVVLNEKLKYLTEWNKKRARIAEIYARQLANVGDIQILSFSSGCSYYVFPVRTKYRDALKDFLLKRGIGTLIHYPRPIHFQRCFGYLGYKRGDLPVSESHSLRVLSLPFGPFLPRKDQDYVINAIKDFFAVE